MKRLGTALHAVQNKLIVRIEEVVESETDVPRTNSWVVDQKRTRVGRVFDIFGPINHPYVVVRPNRGVDAAAHVGKKLYLDEASGRDSKWKKLRS
ncbi:MAG TPA: Gar1/Naf1 family protein [Methanothrix sp.]|nr:Gar1/Naf1 family protein [Methanothrix sp.]